MSTRARLLNLIGSVLVVSTFLAPTGGLYAQSSDVLVLQAAVTHVRSQLPPGQIAIDPRTLALREFHGEQQWMGNRSADVLKSLAVPHGARTSTLDDLLACGEEVGGVRPCHLSGADAVVVLSDPEFLGGAAHVRVSVWRNAVSRRPGLEGKPLVGVTDALLTLKREDGRWRVVEEQVLRRS